MTQFSTLEFVPKKIENIYQQKKTVHGCSYLIIYKSPKVETIQMSISC